MNKKKPIGYTKEQTQSMKTLVERTQKDAGDYVGSGTVTQAPKKKKMKRMMDGGMASMSGNMGGKSNEMRRAMPMPPRKKTGGKPDYETMPIDTPPKKIPPKMMDRLGPGFASARQNMRDRIGRAMPKGSEVMEQIGRLNPMIRGGMDRGGMMRGGGLARKGVGMALAKGGMVKANGCAKRGRTKGKMV